MLDYLLKRVLKLFILTIIDLNIKIFVITNIKDNLAYIFNGNKFEVKSKDFVLSHLLNNHLCNIENFNIERK